MTVTKETGLAGLQARMESEFGSRLMAQLPRLGWDATRLAAHQTERLRVLLAAAIKRSPFHARRLGRIDPARFELADLARLPVMTKAQMMASFDEVVTDRRLTLGRVDDHLRAAGPSRPCCSATTCAWPPAAAPGSAAWSCRQSPSTPTTRPRSCATRSPGCWRPGSHPTARSSR